jgi:hypothetical protein
MSAAFWTPERVTLLLNLADEGKSLSTIAGILGIAKGAVQGKISRLRMTPEQHERELERARRRKQAKKTPTLTQDSVKCDAACVAGVERPGHDAKLSLELQTIAVGAPGKAYGGFVDRRASSRRLPPTAPVAPSLPVLGGKLVPLVELGPFRCKYGVDEDERGRHLFCNLPVLPGSAYCPNHHTLCFQKVQVRFYHRRAA